MPGIVDHSLVVSERRFAASSRKPNRRRGAGAPPREEEREALARVRALMRARKAAERQAKERRRARIAAVLSRPAAKACRCGLSPRVGDDELRALGAGCAGPSYICGTLDAVRRVAAS